MHRVGVDEEKKAYLKGRRYSEATPVVVVVVFFSPGLLATKEALSEACWFSSPLLTLAFCFFPSPEATLPPESQKVQVLGGNSRVTPL